MIKSIDKVMKKLVYLIAIIGLASCQQQTQQNKEDEQKLTIQGEAQGTTYSIVYYPKSDTITKHEVDSILADIDLSLSTWEPASLISTLNNSDSTEIVFEDYNGYFTDMVRYSREVYNVTEGAFDPTVGPLVNAWGFGFKNRDEITPEKIDSLMQYVGLSYDNIRLTRFDDRNTIDPKRILVKAKKGIQFDFNAIAQGYSVDVLGNYFDLKNVDSYLIEVGGEMKAKGTKPSGVLWKVGIDKPVENAEERKLSAIVEVKNEAVATSGNYRKFYVKDGEKYAHTLDPKTGYPVKHNLLSATVLADECWKADAFATAFMVMGTERAIKFLESHKDLGLEVYLISAAENESYETYITESLKKKIEELSE
ncbi:MAG: thiamine biosynthesis protein ApbE [Crocinitomicaceae bacterium]|nr:thiamine biosynthesis protein ApbE [Crocinitomicaceae bacterium]